MPIYLRSADGKTRALTSGKWEASNIEWNADGSIAYFLCNPKLPGTYEVCASTVRDGSLRELTALGGVESYSLSPDGRKLLLRHSSAYIPTRLASVSSSGGAVTALNDVRTPD
jgi:dipeptidyl aminopeptidase/acylaminoacyl peptidase